MNTVRASSLVTVSLPRRMLSASDRVAKRHHMTRSEFVRTALRRYLEEVDAAEAVRIYQDEKKAGKLKTLKGSLAALMG